jgi:beta-lactamase superfamily II metal-dependent hydrolase
MDECAIRVDVLPARLGDCLIVECPRPGRRTWRMIVDGGPPDAWPALRTRLDALRGDDRRVDLVVITHIDSDHIGGLIPLFREGVPGLVIDDVWFNSPPPRRSVRQGELVAALLRARRSAAATGRAAAPTQPWNDLTGGAAVSVAEQGDLMDVDIPDGPRLTVLSPTTKRLAFLFAKWDEAVSRAERGEPDEPDAPPPPPADLTNLTALARTRTDADRSVANGSSIALLLEYRGATALLTGDAFANVLGAALYGLTRSRKRGTIPVDLFKLPHHASRANVTTELLALAPARHYVVSSNGDRFGHPDDIALARVVLAAPPEATIWFNYANDHTLRWSDSRLESTHGYRAAFPDAAGRGLRIELPPRRVEGKQ